jgi:hypothetical protein
VGMVSITSSIPVLAGATGANVVRAPQRERW